MSILTIKNLHAQYNPTSPILKGLHLTMPQHQTTALVGPNGCGKSTLLAVLAGLLTQVKGEIYFENKPWGAKAMSSTGFVFDTVSLPPLLSARSMVKWASSLSRHRLSPVDQEKVLDLCGLNNFHQPFFRMSRGTKQRLAFALALAKKPQLLILDEALSHIDHLHKTKLIQHLVHSVSTKKLTVLLATHSTSDCEQLQAKILHFDKLSVSAT